MGATCAESPVPSVASEELAAGKRWTSLALVMQVGISFQLEIIRHMFLKFSLEMMTHIILKFRKK